MLNVWFQKLIFLGAIPFIGAETERSRATATNGEE
jgi:hypothetical protein